MAARNRSIYYQQCIQRRREAEDHSWIEFDWTTNEKLCQICSKNESKGFCANYADGKRMQFNGRKVSKRWAADSVS